MRVIRASELGSFLFCARAWWYQQQGLPPQNQHQLTAGLQFHRQHGRRVLAARLLTALGWGLLLIALILITVALTIRWLQ